MHLTWVSYQMQISCSTAHTTRLSSSIFIDPCAYSIKFDQNIKCRGGYIKLISYYVNQKKNQCRHSIKVNFLTAFLPHGISLSLKAMSIPMLHVCLAVKIADARSQDFTTCKLIILSLLLNVVSKNLLQPLLLLALGTSDSHIKRVFNLVKTRLNRFKRPNNFEFCFGDHICTYLC